MKEFNSDRRKFVFGSIVLGLVGLIGKGSGLTWAGAPLKSKGEVALPSGEKAAADSDAIVQALGYKPDIKKLDYSKYPQRKKPDAKNQFCKNCALDTPSNDGWGKCQMITNGLVKATGWCGSYNKKA